MTELIDKASLSLDLLGKSGGHKYDNGHVLVLSGEAGSTGAARLAARGALRIGAGLVTLGAPPCAKAEIAAQITALMFKTVGDPVSLRELLSDQRIATVALGPGFGLNEMQADCIRVVLKAGVATVLDADALTIISERPDLFALLHEQCVLTPHEGEFGRLFPNLIDGLRAARQPELEKVREEALSEAVRVAGCCVLLKGPRTLVGSTTGSIAAHSALGQCAAPWLATAGSGDVLTGFIAGLLGKGAKPYDAAKTAVWLHAACARSFGPGLIAEDLPEELPIVLRELFS